MSRSARKLEIREANETLILAAAERVFAQYGYRGTTTTRIADEANLPKSNIHYYFKTKANLYRCVLESILDDWMAAANAFDGAENPERALRKYITAKMNFSRTRPFGSRIWAKEIMAGAPVMEQFLGTTLKKWLEDCERVITGWIKREAIRPVNPRALLYMIWATTQHYADFERQMVILNSGQALSDKEFEAKTEQVITMILASVGLMDEASK